MLLHRLLCGRMKDIASNVKGKTARQQPLRVIFTKLCKKMKHPFLEMGKANIDLCSRRLHKNMPLKLFFRAVKTNEPKNEALNSRPRTLNCEAKILNPTPLLSLPCLDFLGVGSPKKKPDCQGDLHSSEK